MTDLVGPVNVAGAMMFEISAGKSRQVRLGALDSLTEASFTNIDLVMVLGALAFVGLVGAITGVALIL